MYEAFFASGRMGEFEPHVSEPFRAELKAEAERRDEEVRKACLAYITPSALVMLEGTIYVTSSDGLLRERCLPTRQQPRRE